MTCLPIGSYKEPSARFPKQRWLQNKLNRTSSACFKRIELSSKLSHLLESWHSISANSTLCWGETTCRRSWAWQGPTERSAAERLATVSCRTASFPWQMLTWKQPQRDRCLWTKEKPSSNLQNHQHTLSDSRALCEHSKLFVPCPRHNTMSL